MKLPNSKTENIVVLEANNELLIYNLLTNQAFCLNETSAIIYLACDGKTTLEELSRQTKFSDDLILLALEGLQKQNLCQGEKIDYFNGVSRREIIRKAGLASMITLPFIASIIAPVSAQAASSCDAPGAAPGNNFCNGNIPDCIVLCGMFTFPSSVCCSMAITISGSCGSNCLCVCA